MRAWQPGDIDYYNPWSPCGDYASDPNQLLSSSAGGPPPGCPGGGPLDPPAYHVRILVLPFCHSASVPPSCEGQQRVQLCSQIVPTSTRMLSRELPEFREHTRSFISAENGSHKRNIYTIARVTADFYQDVVLTVLGVAELGRYFRVDQTHARPGCETSLTAS